MPPRNDIQRTLGNLEAGIESLSQGQHRLEKGQSELWEETKKINDKIPKDGYLCSFEDKRITALGDKIIEIEKSVVPLKRIEPVAELALKRLSEGFWPGLMRAAKHTSLTFVGVSAAIGIFLGIVVKTSLAKVIARAILDFAKP